MADFAFIKNSQVKKWVILDPKRSRRPNVGHKSEVVCPFCIGREKEECEVYRIGGENGDSSWRIRVILNKFPFADIHELIIHSPDHHKNFDELPVFHVGLIFQTYRERYRYHLGKGQVYIFHNRGIGAGESLPHPHTQLTVIPKLVTLDVPDLDMSIYSSTNIFFKRKIKDNVIYASNFYIYCPSDSQWPDEVWIIPVKKNTNFGDLADKDISVLSFYLQRILHILDLRHGREFPFNFYIYPGKNWYLRIIPRVKILGGFEVGTGIMVNTQDPKETFNFIKEHFLESKIDKILKEQQADYWEAV